MSKRHSSHRLHLSRALLAMALAGLTGLAGLAGCASLPPAERQALIDASRDYSRGDTTSAVQRLDRLIREYGQAEQIAEAYYIRGLCRAKAGQRQAAVQDFEQAIGKSNRADLTAQCRASLAAIAYQSGDYRQAASLYALAVGELPDVPPTDLILYTAGKAMQRVGDWRGAKYQFARILHRFRDRPIAEDARRMVNWRHPYFAIQLGAFRSSDNATEAMRNFAQTGLDAQREFLPRGNQSLWIVMTGRYQTYEEARAALTGIRRRHPDARIIP